MHSNFSYMDYSNFSIGQGALVGAGLALPVAAGGAAVYTSRKRNKEMSPQEQARLKRYANGFNDAYIEAEKADALGFGKNNMPQRQRFARDAERFLTYDSDMTKKYVNPQEQAGVLAGGIGIGAGLGAGAGWLASRK